MKRADKNYRRPRRGLVSVVVLVCLLVLVVMSGVILKQGVTRREQIRAQSRRLQAEYLAEAGLRRARARLASDTNYQGETWTIPAADLGRLSLSQELDAIVTISIGARKVDSKVREIRVEADYPRDPQLRSRQTRRAVVEVESQSTTTGGANK